MRSIVAGILVVLAGGLWWFLSSGSPQSVASVEQKPIVADLQIPDLDDIESAGKAAFEKNCMACHGSNAAGNEGAGPPLVHIIYEPNHHGDAAFLLAAKNGVRAHHWPFGNMPPVEGVSEDEIVSIISYVRKLQRANGIN